MESAPSTSATASTSPMWTYVFERLTANAILPTKSSCAAGFVLRSAYTLQIEPWCTASVLTDLQVTVPSGYIGLISPCTDKDSLLDVVTHVIDHSTAHNLAVLVSNRSPTSITVSQGQQISQIVFVKALSREHDYL